MRPWSRTNAAEYRSLELRARELLADAPLHDVWRVFLPGRDRACTMTEVREVAETAAASQPGSWAVAGLFALRRGLGKAFGWDQGGPDTDSWSLQNRLTDEDRRISLVPPGTSDGPFRIVYVHPHEALSEIRNATVQAYLVWALRPVPDGHELLWAIHVLPVSAWTPAYMALIDPFRRFIVYPALLRRFHAAWKAAEPE